MSKRALRIGMIGYQFMGKAHSHAFRDLDFFFDLPVTPVLQAIAGRNEEAVRQAAEQYGFASYDTDWRRLIERDDIDVIDIVTPNVAHAEMAIAAAQAGKHVICEKPLAMTVEEAVRMREAVEKSGVRALLCHNYRYAPAVQLAKRLIDDGRLGRIYHFRAQYLQDWIMDPNFPLVWRLRKEVTGSGALGDIGAHILDLARFLVGEVRDLAATMETFIKERPLGEMAGGLEARADRSQTGNVDVDDAVAFLTHFDNGALGVFEATRFAAGNRNGNRFEINGERGSLRWDLENMNLLHVYLEDDEPGLQGFRTINCTEPVHPFADKYWPAGHIIGYEHTFMNLFATFFKSLVDGSPCKPDFEDGVRNQCILHTVERSAATKQWETVEYR
ncbi:oxidoreductase [Alicyclobacillus hesperidum subsp. aegles]|uniref:Gfo/Idh/MocA family protein n=1 Tax=Alicyclobacillus hesperidum TaxID=89784 RepID=UPI00222CB962|nr:Gfo/Idh/MocA family oxidoreductase [Alicyclobacillus hesperidum]GLG01557.1 oxidoreductase [Alicyclobacillus hesperidum subsp. aegles]